MIDELKKVNKFNNNNNDIAMKVVRSYYREYRT